MKHPKSTYFVPLLCLSLALCAVLTGCDWPIHFGEPPYEPKTSAAPETQYVPGTSAPAATEAQTPILPENTKETPTVFPCLGRMILWSDRTDAYGLPEKVRTMLYLDGLGGFVLETTVFAPVSYRTDNYLDGSYYAVCSAEYRTGTSMVKDGELLLRITFRFGSELPAATVTDEIRYPFRLDGSDFSVGDFVRDEWHGQSGEIPADDPSCQAGSYCLICGEVLRSVETPHSALYDPTLGVTAEQLADYFAEIALSAEYGGAQTAGTVNKWLEPIRCRLVGSDSFEDGLAIEELAERLNSIPGFPGMSRVSGDADANFTITFCSDEEFAAAVGSAIGNETANGAATVWYDTAAHAITRARVCIRQTVPQAERRSVLLEEIVNSLGFGNDTVLREDSILYQYGSTADDLSRLDELLLRLLYAPEMLPGSDRNAVGTVIAGLYY